MSIPEKSLKNLVALAREGLAMFAADRSKPPEQVAEVATDITMAVAWIDERIKADKPEGQ